MPQNSDRFGWWFWRSNSSMQRVHTPSCGPEFQTLCWYSRTNKKWTSSSSSYWKVSWQLWSWNADTMHHNEGQKKSWVARWGGSPRRAQNRWCRQVGVVSTSSETQRKTGLPARASGRHVVRGRQSSPFSESAWVTGKAGDNGQNSGELGGSSAWTRPSAPECGDTLKAPAGDQRPI